MSQARTLLTILALACLALTPVEKRAVNKAITKIAEAQAHYADSDKKIIEAWAYASKADARAFETDAKIGPLQEQINVSHKNEEELAKKVGKYEPFWKMGHRWFGIGGILQGFGILATHALILIGFIVIALIAFWGLSLAFPILRPIIAIIAGFFKRIWAGITSRR